MTDLESAPAPEIVLERLLAAVKTISPILQSNAAQSDEQGRLATASIEALRSQGLWRTRLCHELGGFELPIVMQIELLAALAAEDTASAWCTMVANDALGILGATMPPAAVNRVFAEGVPACSIVATPGGFAIPVEGGYTVTGIWRLASGVHGSSWIHTVAYVERDPSRPLALAIPSRDIKLLDTWNVVGLAGTGSNDFSLSEYFLPAELAGVENKPYEQVRGLRRYDLVEVEHLESCGHLAFALGVGRRALQELRQALVASAEGRHVADREIFQGQLGQAFVALQAVKALAVSLYDRVDAVCVGQVPRLTTSDRHLPRALAVLATRQALECTQLAFQRAGSAALRRPNILEKLLRDMSVAAKHVVVDDTAFVLIAQQLIETGKSLELA